jgi:DNA-binding NtrC family response regulator
MADSPATRNAAERLRLAAEAALDCGMTLREAQAHFIDAMLRAALRCHRRRTRAVVALGIHRNTFTRLAAQFRRGVRSRYVGIQGEPNQ